MTLARPYFQFSRPKSLINSRETGRVAYKLTRLQVHSPAPKLTRLYVRG